MEGASRKNVLQPTQSLTMHFLLAQPKFQHVIDTRPELTVDPLDADEAGGPCDVCTMGRARHASSLLTLFVRLRWTFLHPCAQSRPDPCPFSLQMP